MDDKYILYDILNSEKNLKVNMACALNEASCDNVYNLYYDMFKDISSEARVLFTIGYNNNWYSLEENTKTKNKDAYTKLKKELHSE